MVLKQDGSVWATGYNKYGQLGDGTTTNRSEFTKVFQGGAIALAAGHFHSIVLKEDGSVWATGRNEEGQLGSGYTRWRSSYTMVTGTRCISFLGHDRPC